MQTAYLYRPDMTANAEFMKLNNNWIIEHTCTKDFKEQIR